jgi:ribosome-binding factor A
MALTAAKETMSRRTDRVANLIRNTLGEILLSKMADPRFDPVKTSITRVEVPEDLLTARVYISVAGEEKQRNKTLAALRSASGFLQERLTRRIRLKHTPKLEFRIDEKFRKTMETLNLISEVMSEIHEKDRQRLEADGESAGEGESP